ncbi:hypothetical protein [Vulcanisaeta distributa]|nr:hypothetical protein [Vulcanisaeta distributa]
MHCELVGVHGTIHAVWFWVVCGLVKNTPWAVHGAVNFALPWVLGFMP